MPTHNVIDIIPVTFNFIIQIHQLDYFFEAMDMCTRNNAGRVSAFGGGDGGLGGGGAHYRLIERFMNALNSIEVERLLCKSEKRVEH